MCRITVVAAIILLAIVPLAVTACRSGGVAFRGTWRLDASRSQLNVPAPQSQVVRISVQGKDVRMEQRIVNERGERLSIAVDARFDGRDYPVTGTPFADTVAYRLTGTRTIEGVAKKAGRVVVTETAVLAPDGRSLTVTYRSHLPDGRAVTSTAVFERIEDERPMPDAP
jgi:hypothetical protein